MPIVQQGSINTTAIVVPDLYVQIVPPQNLVPNGVPTNTIGVVGSASWGPTNVAMTVGTAADYVRIFGAIKNRTFDMGTPVFTAVLQGASSFRCVRVSDGTDVAASIVVLSTCITLSGLYTGVVGNTVAATISAGTAASTTKIIVGFPGQPPEVFDNIAGAGNALWVAMAAAINTGAGVLRGPSQIITAAAGVGTTAPALGTTYTLTGGTDGSTITEALLIGQDVVPRKGMYALRNQGCSIGVLSDCFGGAGGAANTWLTQAAFGLSEGLYMICVGPSGDTASVAIAQKAASGVDTYAVKLMFGDWLWWWDPQNAVTRKVSPQGFVAGRLSNLSPEQSSLNKPLYGIVGSDKQGIATSQVSSYSSAELAVLFGAGIDVVANPAPGGAYWAVRAGHNSSSAGNINGDNYTRLTNYIASTLNSAMGGFVGATISVDLFRRVRASVLSYLMNLYQQSILVSLDGQTLPFSVVCDATNNPLSRTGIGYVQCDVQVQFPAINEKFIVNIEGGQTVQVTKQTILPGNSSAQPSF